VSTRDHDGPIAPFVDEAPPFASQLPFEMRDDDAAFESDEHEVEDFDRFLPLEAWGWRFPMGMVRAATIGFEFDLNVGLEGTVFSKHMPVGSTMPAEHEALTDHDRTKDGFETKRDGPRLEIATTPIEIDDHKTFKNVAANILKFAKELEAARAKTKPDTSITVPHIAGHPVWFEHARTKPAKLPLVIAPRGGSSSLKWPTDSNVWAAPQATITIRLERVAELVDHIQATAGKGRGLALTGDKHARLGVRSDIVVLAKKRVLADRSKRIGTVLSDKTKVTAADFSDRLSGLLILMTQYMLAGEVLDASDYERFAKGYLPLNVKAPFRTIFHHTTMLTDRDRLVFKDIYYAHPENFYGLARDGATAHDGATKLFPPKAKSDLERFYTTVPTWEMLLKFTVDDTPLKVTKANTVHKKHHALGDEILWAPLSSIIPVSATEPRVALELRRIGYTSHGTASWHKLMTTVLALTKKLNS
jgi:hypothetical protein